ncbi:MAG: VOC family protein [Sphingosinicella sp.]|nr:VOC family protein [Sphingosinicella sp.]
MASVTGLGGIFYKVEDPDRTRAWYQEKLGVGGEWGAMFPWKADEGGEAYSLFSPFKAASDYFDPSEARFMVNLRVDDLAAMIEELKGKDVEILGTQYEDYGKFAWILDCDGIKIELWEQVGPVPA